MHCICLLICIIQYLLDTVVKIKGVAYVEATEAAVSVNKYMQKKNIKTIKFYFHVLNKGTINKLTV
jgi:hypothetical protein